MQKEEDFFGHRYFVMNKRFMSHIGTWPFQSDWAGRMRRWSYFVLFFSAFLVEFVRFLQYWPSPFDIFAIVPSMFARILVFIKWYNIVLQPSKMKSLFRHMQEDWKNIQDVSERMIMETYGEIGRKTVVSYTCFLYVSMVIYMAMPFAPIILDVLIPLNQSRERKFLFDAEYFVDPDEYYSYVAAHGIFSTVITITIIIAIDTTYMIYGNHVCSQFAIVCYRLENSFGRSVEIGKDAHVYLAFSIRKHKKAIEFASCVESSFRLSMLLQVMICVLCISITGVQIVRNVDETDEVVRVCTYGGGQICHLFFLNHPGQRVMDHSNQVFQSAYMSKWYAYSVRARKMLQLVLVRSMTPSVFTAGKVCVLSMETFISIVQTTMSYFTVLSSV